jgi:hypothetical protein
LIGNIEPEACDTILTNKIFLDIYWGGAASRKIGFTHTGLHEKPTFLLPFFLWY